MGAARPRRRRTRRRSGDIVSETRRWLAGRPERRRRLGHPDDVTTHEHRRRDRRRRPGAARRGRERRRSAAIRTRSASCAASRRADGGFPYVHSRRDVPNAESTALGHAGASTACRIDQATWIEERQHARPSSCAACREPNGSFAHRRARQGQSTMMTTTQATIALAGKAVPLRARRHDPHSEATCPSFSSFKPANGAVFSSTNDVLVPARVHGPQRTAPASDKDAVRIIVDSVNKTKSARVYSGKLYLEARRPQATDSTPSRSASPTRPGTRGRARTRSR